jgi:hypothetical protein
MTAPFSPWPKAFVSWGNVDAAFAVDWRSDGQILVAGCAQGQFAWAQLKPLKATTDFAGPAECASGAKFAGNHQIVLAGTQTFNGNANFALARFDTTAIPIVPRLFLPLIVR